MVSIRGIIDYRLLSEEIRGLICSLSIQNDLSFCDDGILLWHLHYRVTDRELLDFASLVNKAAKEQGISSNGHRIVRVAVFFGKDNYEEII